MRNHEQAFTAARLIIDDPSVSASIRNLAVCYLVMRHDYTPAQGRVIVDLKAALEAANETVKAMQGLIAEKDAVLMAYKSDLEAAQNENHILKEAPTVCRELEKIVIAKLEAELDAIKKQMIPQIGDRVCVAHWGDFDPNDAVQIGTLTGTKDSRYFIEGDMRWWRHCVVLFRAEAEAKEQDSK